MSVENKILLFERKELCCGCTACCSICAKNAISMVEDVEGFVYPKIDETKCVKCQRCLKVCPIRNTGAIYGFTSGKQQ